MFTVKANKLINGNMERTLSFTMISFLLLASNVIGTTFMQRVCMYERLRLQRNMTSVLPLRHTSEEISRAPTVNPVSMIFPLDVSQTRKRRVAVQTDTMDAMNGMNYRKRGTADYVHSRQKRMLIDIHSPTETTDTSEEPTNARSLCPWTYIFDVNITRYPRKLMKAVCNHNAGDNSCDFSSSRVFDAFPRIMDRLRLDTECEIVYGQIMVVYECCEDGNYSRIDEWVEWPVACACSRKRVRVVQPAS